MDDKMLKQETADLVTFTEEILNGKLHFLCSESNFDSKSFVKIFILDKFCNWQIFAKNFLFFRKMQPFKSKAI